MNNSQLRSVSPNGLSLIRKQSAATFQGKLAVSPRPSLEKDKENHFFKAGTSNVHIKEEELSEILAENTISESGFVKHTVSKTLAGKCLQEATLRQKEESIRERTKVYPPLMKGDGPLLNQEPTKTSSKRNGIVSSYAACTNRGTVRGYNQDRISIILSVARQNKELQGPMYFFGLYDGHGGSACCDFLRDHMHSLLAKQPELASNPVEALRRAVKQAETDFIAICEQKGQKSGSTLLALLLYLGKVYIANVGDCRAVLSSNRGKNYTNLTRDHKPCDQGEQARIIKAGGKIFQTRSTVTQELTQKVLQDVIGPLRVFPGRLSVSRTIGDPQAKLQKHGGHPHVVICDPEITVFELGKEHDFIILCTDGVFDKLDSADLIDTAWKGLKGATVHEACGKAVENVVREAMNKRSLDNISALLIGFAPLEEQFQRMKLKAIEPKEQQEGNQTRKNLR